MHFLRISDRRLGDPGFKQWHEQAFGSGSYRINQVVLVLADDRGWCDTTTPPSLTAATGALPLLASRDEPFTVETHRHIWDGISKAVVQDPTGPMLH